MVYLFLLYLHKKCVLFIQKIILVSRHNWTYEPWPSNHELRARSQLVPTFRVVKWEQETTSINEAFLPPLSPHSQSILRSIIPSVFSNWSGTRSERKEPTKWRAVPGCLDINNSGLTVLALGCFALLKAIRSTRLIWMYLARPLKVIHQPCLAGCRIGKG